MTALGIASANEFPDVCNELNHWGQPDSTTDVEVKHSFSILPYIPMSQNVASITVDDAHYMS